MSATAEFGWIFGTTQVATALPRIVTDLLGSDRFVWVVTAYMLCSTVTIPL